MPDDARCPRCGTEFPRNPRDGLCPACLIKAVLQNEDEDGAQLGEEGEGLRFGAYTTVRLLGQGGMGIVYLARQEQPVRRTVALKVVKPRTGSPHAIARFESQRDALAGMEHPNIARMFDAGTTADGRLFFAMEYVPGLPIVEYCNANRLTNRERLELFSQVCRGVHHAHQQGIIHRGIKGSNVLVEVLNRKPVPKVIELGVAAAILVTGHEQLIDAKTDIYSLGALLYEMLVGAPPFNLGEDATTRPADRLRAMGDTAARAAAWRQTDVRSMERDLAGDLEWITLRAMDKDRSRRYPSASELAADIARHLKDEPVLAGPASAGYRIGKFVRRNRAKMTAAALVALAVLAVVIAGTAR